MGFGGFKAPAKADLLDAFLEGMGDEQEENQIDDRDSLRDDGKPAQIRPSLGRRQSEQKVNQA